MSSLQATSAPYNPMTGGAVPPYGHPYGSAHHQPPPMHPAAHMHAVHHQAQQHNLSVQQNPHMMPVQNGPVILVSNLNEEVSSMTGKLLFFNFSFPQ